MYLITFAIVTAFIAFLLYSFIYLATPKKKIYDFIIIHGAGLRESEVDKCLNILISRLHLQL